jgi:hypothetical protein
VYFGILYRERISGGRLDFWSHGRRSRGCWKDKKQYSEIRKRSKERSEGFIYASARDVTNARDDTVGKIRFNCVTVLD